MDRPKELKAFKKFVSYCKNLETDEVSEENRQYIKVYVSDIFRMINQLSKENKALSKRQ